MKWLFFTGLVVVFYTYIGYPIVLFFLVKIKKVFKKDIIVELNENDLPDITFIVAAYNEADILKEKVTNTLSLDYPKEKFKVFFVMDGSTDNSQIVLSSYPEIKVFHESERRGKNAAVNRVMNYVESPIVILSDANTYLNNEALKKIVYHYSDPRVGGVAGEKRVISEDNDNAAGSGEGAYWKYESQLKKWDSELNTVVGAAGELISFRTDLYEPVPSDVIIEDFRLSLKIAMKGFKVAYEPGAYAQEAPSASTKEEYKRKVRIAAGGLKEVGYFWKLLNFFKYGLLSFQYISHRMLRWTLAPLGLLVVLVTNIFLISSGELLFILTGAGQSIFYFLALIGYLQRNKKLLWKPLFIPYYFLFMNLAVYHGFYKMIFGTQSAVWDKATRASIKPY